MWMFVCSKLELSSSVQYGDLWLDLGVFSWLLLMQKCKRFRIKSYLEREEMWFWHPLKLLLPFIRNLLTDVGSLTSSCHLKQTDGLLIQSIQGIILCSIKTWNFSSHFPQPLFTKIDFFGFFSNFHVLQRDHWQNGWCCSPVKREIKWQMWNGQISCISVPGQEKQVFYLLSNIFGRKSKTWSDENKH